MFICNSTSWITTIQGGKYKIQDNSNRHISYIMYTTTSINRATTTRSSQYNIKMSRSGYVPSWTCPEVTMSRNGYVPKRLCPEVAMSRNGYVPKRLCPETAMSRSGYVPKRLCPETSGALTNHIFCFISLTYLPV